MSFTSSLFFHKEVMLFSEKPFLPLGYKLQEGSSVSVSLIILLRVPNMGLTLDRSGLYLSSASAVFVALGKSVHISMVEFPQVKKYR